MRNVSEEEAQQVVDARDAQQATFRENLKSWCIVNGYKGASLLLTEVGFPPRQARTIVSEGWLPARSPELLGRLYLRTGILEADPRRIPPRVVASQGKKKIKRQAWTEEQWQRWIKSQELAEQGRPREEEPEPSAVPKEEIRAASAVDHGIRIFDEFASLIAPPLAKRLQELLPPLSSEATSREEDLGTLLRRVIGMLERYTNNGSTAQQRDALLREHGEALRALFFLLDPLTKKGSQREELLRLNTAAPQLTRTGQRRGRR